MARLREYHDGRTRKWEVQWSVERARQDGKRDRKHFSQAFRTKEQAETFKRQKEDQAANNPTMLDPTKGRQPLKEWADAWFKDWEPSVKVQTATKSRGLLDCSIIPTFGGMQLRKIEPADIQAWINGLSEPDPDTKRRRKPATIRHHYLVLKAVLDYAVQNRALTVSPAASIHLPTNKRMGMQPRKMRFLTEDEVNKLADVFDEDPYPLMIRFMAWSGLRVGEVAGLNIGDVDLDREVVHVERTRRKATRAERAAYAAEHPDADPGAGEWILDTIKNGEWHDAPINAVWDDLSDYLDAHPHADDPNAPLFPGRTTIERTRHGSTSAVDYSKPFDPGVFYKRHFLPALDAAGLPAMRMHDLRHTFASLCHRHHIPVQQVSYWMGHKDVTVTQVIYSHLYKDDTAEHGKALGQAAKRTRKSTKVMPLRKEA